MRTGLWINFHTMTILWLVNLVAIIAVRADDVGPIVEIPQGKLRGLPATTWQGRNITEFLGIPFAEPPTENLRFEPPVEHSGWEGIFEANYDGPECMQLSGTEVLGSEDCLHLNVFTPMLPSKTKGQLLPVMVYVFGGTFKAGSDTSIRYNGKYLLDEDLVIVAPNYRLGPLGFLSTGDHVVPGNNGFKDIVHAFKWVQNNIQYFGGDPDQVTLVGHSSGAATAHLLALSPLMDGLFHRYVTQSGSAVGDWAFVARDYYHQRAWQLGGFVGCSSDLSSVELVECLRETNATDIISTWTKFLPVSSYPDVVWTCTDELESPEAFLYENPKDMVAAGKIRDLPFMTGVTRDEGLAYSSCFYFDEDSYNELISNLEGTLPYLLYYYQLPINQSAFTRELIDYYFNDLTAEKSEILSNITTLIGDSLFYYPAWVTLRQQIVHATNPVYFYTFNYLGTFSHTMGSCGTEVLGVGHADELTYLFDEYEYMFASYNKSLSDTDYDMTRKMVPLWASFVKTGVPSTSFDPDAPVWRAYDASERNILRIGDGSSTSIGVQNTFHDERMQFWDELTAKYF